jgi:hypothetical protein
MLTIGKMMRIYPFERGAAIFTFVWEDFLNAEQRLDSINQRLAEQSSERCEEEAGA